MENQTKSAGYQQALALAEAGQHEQALRLIRIYLQTTPNDPEALNDAGTILFCMNRGTEAIELLEKARPLAQGDLLSQILWNLCEAYLQEDRPAEAASLFDAMEENKILNIEMLNRAADVFLQREALGGAMECLLRSLGEESQQDILRPIAEVIRFKRPVVTLIVDPLTVTSQTVYEWLNLRFRTELIVADSRQMPTARGGLTIAVGVGQTLRHFALQKQTAPSVVILTAEDVYHPLLEQINWSHVGQVLLCGSSAQIDALGDRIPDIHKKTHLQTTDEPLDLRDWTFAARSQGKRLAAAGPFNAHSNPAVLLQCMQKLNYLDRDYRLYLAGGFEDRATEQYCRYMISRLNLDGVVIIENAVGNLSAWLRDKHYIVHTPTTSGNIRSVWAAMACGLKPVISAFAGCEDVIDGRYVFGIAEEFCAQIRSEDYQPHSYRNWVEQRMSKQGFFKTFYVCLSKIERQLALQAAHPLQTAAPSAAPQTTFIPAKPAAPSIPAAFMPAPAIDRAPQPQFVQPKPQPVWQQPASPIQIHSKPVIDITPRSTPSPVAQTAWQPPHQQQQWQATAPVSPPIALPTAGKSISQIAEDALKASRRLRDIISHAEQDAETKTEETAASPFVR